MGKRNSRNLKSLYCNPLPIVLSSNVYGTLPDIYPHNPFSWVYFAYKYLSIQSKVVPQSITENVRVDLENSIFKVTCKDGMELLWRLGFFGKGILSRSDPSWDLRVRRRLNLQRDGRDVTVEEITNVRRDERKKFKQQRAKFQELELKQKKGELSESGEKELETLKGIVSNMRNMTLDAQVTLEEFDYEGLRKEDQAIVDENSANLKVDLEFLQLQPVEVFFLAFGLNVINIFENGNKLTLMSLFEKCCGSEGIFNTNNFLLNYAVYHHYRSLGWCVRSGIKFGCDFLLYERGPPFSHAEFAIMVIPTDSVGQLNWFDMTALLRVISGVKKHLILTFVEPPSQEVLDDILSCSSCDPKTDLTRLIECYKVTEILYRRWVPSRTRD